MLSPLFVRSFRWYWLCMFISLMGTWIQSVALSWFAFELSRSAVVLGFMGFMNTLPVGLLGLLGGTLADRRNKRTILIVTQSIFMVLALILALLTQFHLVSVSTLIIIAVCNGLVMAFDAPTRHAMIVDLVGRKDLPQAIALNSVSFNASKMIGPLVATALIGVIGMSGCFYLNAVSFVPLIFVLFAYAKIPLSSHVSSEQPFIASLQEGLEFIFHHREILGMMFVVASMSLFGFSYLVLLPVYAHDVLNGGLAVMGYLMSGVGAGALFGAIMLGIILKGEYRKRYLALACIVFFLGLLLLSMVTVLIQALIALMLIGASAVFAVSLVNTLVQRMVPDHYRGRVMSVFLLVFCGFTPFGNLLLGSLAQYAGVARALMLSAMACCICFVCCYVYFPSLVRKSNQDCCTD